MTAVVTGASGFIGRILVAELAGSGPVIGIDRRPADAATGGSVHLTADLLVPDDAVHNALSCADVVFHLAGCGDVRDPRPDADMHRYRDNGLATAAVLATVPPQTPVFVASSSSVYGGSRDGRPCHEDDAVNPLGGYARSKVLVEQIAAGRRAAGGNVVVFRPFTVAGEGQRPGMALSRWIVAAREDRPLRVFGSLDRTRDITDVRQMAAALIDLAAAERDQELPLIINIGTGQHQRLGELVEAVGVVLGRPIEIEVVDAEKVEVEHTLASTDRLRTAIGWAPKTDLLDLVARQVEALDRGLVTLV
jgi:nucleoside-diphosphate-sugar epimerase